jgi:hypothetical protein
LDIFGDREVLNEINGFVFEFVFIAICNEYGRLGSDVLDLVALDIDHLIVDEDLARSIRGEESTKHLRVILES